METTDAAAVLALAPFERLFTREEYHTLACAGVLTEDDRVELIRGRIVTMSPVGPPHFHTVNRLERLLAQRAYASTPPLAHLSVQNPVDLGEHNEPEPDLALLRPDMPEDRIPIPDDLLLVIEVSDATLNQDRLVKRRLYAAVGVPELWIVALPLGLVEVYRSPEGGDYADPLRLMPGSDLTVEALPDLPPIPVADVLGKK
ncbi:MAG: Uma2 family endonuclease [Bacteroidota bacterium]